MRVLIADDDRVSRLTLAHTLELWNHEVVAAADGAQAWELLQRDDAPQLAILDWVMPGLTGPEVCAKVRARAKEPYTYILLLTSKTHKEDLVAGMEAGADDYVTKSKDNQELRVRLRAGQRILELQAELVAAREKLRQQATHDILTGLWNRYYILDFLTREINRAARESTGLAVIMADVDHFKRVNDTYGHLAGDTVLREAARRLQATIRSYDAVGRYGGEEFLVVLPGADQVSAIHLAHRLRESVCSAAFPIPDAAIEVTASLGVTAWAGGFPPTPTNLIAAADVALFRSKCAGRNRVEYQPTEATTLQAAS